MGLISMPSFYVVGREAFNTATPPKLVALGNYKITSVIRRSAS